MENIFRKGQKTAIMAGSVTLFSAFIKAIAGFFSGRVVLMADAIHSGADSISTFIALIGLTISKRKPSKKFPYGFYKAENIAAFFVSVLIFIAGFEILRGSYSKLFMSYQLHIPVVAMAVAIFDALTMFLVGSYELKVGKTINSQSLMADGKESRMHLFSSSIVLVGLVSAFFKVPYLEGIMGILISLFIFQVGVESMRDSLLSLMDVSPNPKMGREIGTILKGISGLKGFEDLRLRKAGPYVFGEVKVRVRKTMDVRQAHEISDTIEREIKKQVKMVDSFTVILEPFETKKQKIAIPLEEDEGLASEISSNFARSNKFIFVDVDNGKIKNYYVKQNPYREKEVRAGLSTSMFILKEKIDSVITNEIGPISLHTLRDNIVDVYQATEGNIEELVRSLSEERLKLLNEPTKQRV